MSDWTAVLTVTDGANLVQVWDESEGGTQVSIDEEGVVDAYTRTLPPDGFAETAFWFNSNGGTSESAISFALSLTHANGQSPVSAAATRPSSSAITPLVSPTDATCIPFKITNNPAKETTPAPGRDYYFTLPPGALYPYLLQKVNDIDGEFKVQYLDSPSGGGDPVEHELTVTWSEEYFEAWFKPTGKAHPSEPDEPPVPDYPSTHRAEYWKPAQYIEEFEEFKFSEDAAGKLYMEWKDTTHAKSEVTGWTFKMEASYFLTNLNFTTKLKEEHRAPERPYGVGVENSADCKISISPDPTGEDPDVTSKFKSMLYPAEMQLPRASQGALSGKTGWIRRPKPYVYYYDTDSWTATWKRGYNQCTMVYATDGYSRRVGTG